MKKAVQLLFWGILLVEAAKPLAMAERGYTAIGGEYLLLIAPWLIDELITSIKDIFDFKDYEVAGEE